MPLARYVILSTSRLHPLSFLLGRADSLMYGISADIERDRYTGRILVPLVVGNNLFVPFTLFVSRHKMTSMPEL